MNCFIVRSAALLLVGLITTAPPATAAPFLYRVTDLGFDAGFLTINDHGHLAATRHVGDSVRAYYWSTATGWQDIGLLPDGTGAEVRAFNNHGQIVGNGDTPQGSRPFLWSPDQGMQMLDLLPSDANAYAIDINNQGQVLLNSNTDTGQYASYVWSVEDGLTPIAGMTLGRAINDSGSVVGWMVTGSQVRLWTPGEGVATLPTIPLYQQLRPGPMNNAGQVVAVTRFEEKGMLWNPDGTVQRMGGTYPYEHNIGDSYDGRGLELHDINDQGQVVGTTNGQAFIWDPRLDSNPSLDPATLPIGPLPNLEWAGMLNLNTLLDDASNGWFLTAALGINNQGQIVAWGRHDDHGVRSLLLTPVPEPSTFLLGALGAAGVAFAAQRRRRLGSN